MTSPRISIVIPTANRPQELMRALRSVSGQSFKDFEIIVVVDGPNEGTLAALNTLVDSRIRIIHNHVPIGAARARNAGAEAATATFIAFLDDDDEWDREKLERQLAVAGSGVEPLIVM